MVAGQRRKDRMTTPRLYPSIEPHRRFQLPVGDGHELYVECCGNPDGKPVVVLHGGPGAGCSPFMRRFFDPKRYRIVLFDQRGCGKSTPTGSLEANTAAGGVSTDDLSGGETVAQLALLILLRRAGAVVAA